jgi:hypothetical protein
MILNEHVKVRAEKFGAVIFETLREKVFITNETGRDVLNLMAKGYSEGKIIEALATDYSVEAAGIKEDVLNFISQLKNNNIAQ